MTNEREAIRERYATAAGTAVDPMMKDGGTRGANYYHPSDIEALPVSAAEASLGCANPVALADLHEGETVLDLGSGGGIDVLLSARRVGRSGKAYGLDMTDEMLTLARENQQKAGLKNVEFMKGFIEAIPLPTAAVDVVLSNCVINLSVDKPAVFTEMFRVLRPGGRLAIADVVVDDQLSSEQRAALAVESSCLATALTHDEYGIGLREAGFEDISIAETRPVASGFSSVIVRARKR